MEERTKQNWTEEQVLVLLAESNDDTSPSTRLTYNHTFYENLGKRSFEVPNTLNKEMETQSILI